MPAAHLATQGVFEGTLCGLGFCPGEPIDRKTMAVWTVRVLDDVDPTAVSESRFDDVDVPVPRLVGALGCALGDIRGIW